MGAISVKGLTPTPRNGNPGTRIAETPSGVLNCIGLENPGAEAFVRDILPELKQYDVPILANISAADVEGYEFMAKTLSVPGIAGLEVNISCPNAVWLSVYPLNRPQLFVKRFVKTRIYR